MKKLANTFIISPDVARAGVIRFSSQSELSIKLRDCNDIVSFSNAVDALSLNSSTSRIDRALRRAQKDLFTPENGGRLHVRKLLVLLIDVTQHAAAYSENPGVISDELREIGVSVIVIGIGNNTDIRVLDYLAGGDRKAFLIKSFDELSAEDFVIQLKEKACSEGMLFACIYIQTYSNQRNLISTYSIALISC